MSSSGFSVAVGPSRAIARAAVSTQLSLSAFELVLDKGYDNVTLDDMAAAGGVSRTTFRRYFPTKDRAMVAALHARAGRIADAVRARPADEDDWTALEQALTSLVLPDYLKNRAEARAMTELIRSTPMPTGRSEPPLHDWRMPLAQALADREGITGSVSITLQLKAAIALECLNHAVSEWIATEGALDLLELLEECFRVVNAGICCDASVG